MTLKTTPLSIRTIVLATLTGGTCLGLTSCSTGDDHDAIEARIEELGGKVNTYSRGTIQQQGLPADLLGKIGFVSFQSEDLSGVDLSDLIPLESIQILDLSGCQLREGQLGFLGEAKRLEDLYLHATSITDDSLRDVAKIGGLRYLDINFCPITDIGLEHLVNAKSLTGLDIVETQVTRDGARRFRDQRPDIRFFTWSKTPSEDVLDALVQLVRLDVSVGTGGQPLSDKPWWPKRYSLTLSKLRPGCEQQAVELVNVAAAAVPTTVSFPCGPLEDMPAFGSLRNVEEFVFAQNFYGGRDDNSMLIWQPRDFHWLLEIPEVPRIYLKELERISPDLADTLGNTRGLTELKTHQQTIPEGALERITMESIEIDEQDGVAFCQHLPNLRELTLSSRNTEFSLAPLLKCPNLESLAVRMDRVGDPEVLGELTWLTELEITSRLPSDFGRIATLQHLRKFTLSKCPLDNASMDVLMKMDSLKEIHFKDYMSVEPAIVQRIREKRPEVSLRFSRHGLEVTAPDKEDKTVQPNQPATSQE